MDPRNLRGILSCIRSRASKDSAGMPELYQFELAFTPEGWRGPVWIAVDGTGWIAAVHQEKPPGGPAVPVAGAALPGVPNLHSHAFQRALSGRTETGGS